MNNFAYNNLSDKRFTPLRALPSPASYKAGDVLVLFGELFSRGYANGIVDQATRAGMKIIRTTVGRRDGDSALRKLNAEELAQITDPIINIPLEAGFDLEPCEQDQSRPVDQLRAAKLTDWASLKLDWQKIDSSQKRARNRFTENVKNFVLELQGHIPKSANVLFVHTMAGGVPRAKIVMPLMNRVFKGTGDRHMASHEFWQSDIGRLAERNFNEVTADTFDILLSATSAMRSGIESAGGSVRYVAYGYHGTEVLIDDKITYQTYSPYVQGWAKMRLEDHARKAWQAGVKACVYNCPEILTNSSSIFQGVEVSLYPFIGALQKVANARINSVLDKCRGLLKPDHDFKEVLDFTSSYLSSDIIRQNCDFAKWPQHNNKAQMEKMLNSSDHLIGLHSDEKKLMTAVLSEEVFTATGKVMFDDSFKLQAPVLWLGHDILAAASAKIN